jgi:uracil-DNA glycosylase
VAFLSFPFHPHQTKNKNSNRKPATSELENCNTFLKEIIEQFNIPKTGIIAVGRVAQIALKELNNIEAKYIRHPANGGAKKFNEQLKEIIS